MLLKSHQKYDFLFRLKVLKKVILGVFIFCCVLNGVTSNMLTKLFKMECEY